MTLVMSHVGGGLLSPVVSRSEVNSIEATYICRGAGMRSRRAARKEDEAGCSLLSSIVAHAAFRGNV